MAKATKKGKKTDVSENEQVGFHKGALSTLAKEREELMRMLGIVEQLMRMHIKSLKDLGIDLEEAARQAQGPAGAKKKKSKKLEEEL